MPSAAPPSMCAREADYRPIERGLIAAQAALDDHDGGDDHRDEQERPDGPP
jgi:hypothetical protein